MRVITCTKPRQGGQRLRRLVRAGLRDHRQRREVDFGVGAIPIEQAARFHLVSAMRLCLVSAGNADEIELS